MASLAVPLSKVGKTTLLQAEEEEMAASQLSLPGSVVTLAFHFKVHIIWVLQSVLPYSSEENRLKNRVVILMSQLRMSHPSY